MPQGGFLRLGTLVGLPPRRKEGCELPCCLGAHQDSTRPQYDPPFLACSPVVNLCKVLVFREKKMGKKQTCLS